MTTLIAAVVAACCLQSWFVPQAHGAAAPQGVHAVAGPSSVMLQWEAVPLVTSYRIYESTAAGTTGSLVATVPATSTSFLRTGLSNGTRYFYTVRSFDGIESADPVPVLSSVATLPAARQFDQCTAYARGKIFAFGGTDGTLRNTILSFDPLTNTVATETAVLPTARSLCGAAEALGDVFILGGNTGGSTGSAQILRYNTAAGTMSTLPEALTPGRMEFGIETINGAIYTFGGRNSGLGTDETLKYTPGSGTNTTVISKFTGRQRACIAAARVGSRAIMIGGKGGGAFLPSILTEVFRFDPESTYTDGAVLPSARSCVGAASLNSYVYGFGGNSTATSQIVRYDNAANQTVTLTTTLPSARWYVAAERARGFIYLLGGQSGASAYVDSVLRFSPGGQAPATPAAATVAAGTGSVSASVAGTDVTITWPAATNVDEYRIFRSSVAGETGHLIEEQLGSVAAPATSIVDGSVSAGTWHYTVRAIGWNDVEITLGTATVGGAVNAAPVAPTSLAQYRADGATAIAGGAWTSDGAGTNVVLRFNVSDPDPGQVLTPWVEVRSSAASFASTCGTATSGVTFSGASVTATTGGASYVASVPVTGLGAGSWVWRACVVDQASASSSWVALGGAPDFRIDAVAPAAAEPTSPEAGGAALAWPALVARYVDAVQASPGTLQFELCPDSTCSSPTASGSSASGLATGTTGQWTPSSPAGTYWWRARGVDSAGGVGPWSATRSIRVGADGTTVSVSAASLDLGVGGPNEDRVGTVDVSVSTDSIGGYRLLARDTSDSLAVIASPGVGYADVTTAAAAPMVWAAGQAGGGVSVISATAGRQVVWGTGGTWPATDFLNNRFAGLGTTDRMLHERPSYSSSTDTVRVAYRATAGASTSPGTYSTVVTFTAVALV